MTEIIPAPAVSTSAQQLSVLQYPHPLLSAASAPVLTDIVTDQRLQQLLRDMVETMRASRGIGLAAVQVGVPLRVLVVLDTRTDKVTKVINPFVLKTSEKSEVSEEGCLSFLGVFTKVRRPVEAVVEFFDENGVKQTTVNNGLLGRAIQHEIDHLDGKTMMDRVSSVERTDILRQQKRIQRKIKAYVKAQEPKFVDKKAAQKAKKAKRNKNKR